MLTPADVLGREFDWLAIDRDGYVGLFSTAGGGYAPPAVLRDAAAHDAAIEALLGLPPTSAVSFAPELAPELTNTWRLAAERGVFAFDSDPNGGPYRLVAAPAKPSTPSMFDQRIRRVASLLRLDRVVFSVSLVVGEDVLRDRA